MPLPFSTDWYPIRLWARSTLGKLHYIMAFLTLAKLTAAASVLHTGLGGVARFQALAIIL